MDAFSSPRDRKVEHGPPCRQHRHPRRCNSSQADPASRRSATREPLSCDVVDLRGRQLPRSCSGRLRSLSPLLRSTRSWRRGPSCPTNEPGPPEWGRQEEFPDQTKPARKIARKPGQNSGQLRWLESHASGSAYREAGQRPLQGGCFSSRPDRVCKLSQPCPPIRFPHEINGLLSTIKRIRGAHDLPKVSR